MSYGKALQIIIVLNSTNTSRHKYSNYYEVKILENDKWEYQNRFQCHVKTKLIESWQ